jgi:hypothetical protein
MNILIVLFHIPCTVETVLNQPEGVDILHHQTSKGVVPMATVDPDRIGQRTVAHLGNMDSVGILHRHRRLNRRLFMRIGQINDNPVFGSPEVGIANARLVAFFQHQNGLGLILTALAFKRVKVGPVKAGGIDVINQRHPAFSNKHIGVVAGIQILRPEFQIAQQQVVFPILRLTVGFEASAQNIEVKNNIYGTVYALDEGDTFGLWEFEETAVGKALDKDRLHPGRDNDLLFENAEIIDGAASLKLGKALSFSDRSAEASPVQEWSGAPGVRIHMMLKIPAGFDRDKSTVFEVSNIYSLYLDEDALCFEFRDPRGKKTVLSVGQAARARRWLPIIAEVDPVTGRAVLEVSGLGGDRRFIDGLELNGKQRPLTIAPSVSGEKKFTGAVDQLWIQNLHQ